MNTSEFSTRVPTEAELASMTRSQAKETIEILRGNAAWMADKCSDPQSFAQRDKLKAAHAIHTRLHSIAHSPLNPAEQEAQKRQWQPHSETEIAEAKQRILEMKSNAQIMDQYRAGNEAIAEAWRANHQIAFGSQPVIQT